MQQIGFEGLAELRCARPELPPLQLCRYPHIKKIVLRGDQWLSFHRIAPRRKFMENKGILKYLEILINGRAGNLGIVGNIRKVDNRTIAKSSDLKETAKGRYIPGNPLGDNLLLQIRARIGLKIRPGVVRKINRGDQSPFDNAK